MVRKVARKVARAAKRARRRSKDQKSRTVYIWNCYIIQYGNTTIERHLSLSFHMGRSALHGHFCLAKNEGLFVVGKDMEDN